MKNLLPKSLLLSLLVLAFSANSILAATLTKIGDLDVSGQNVSGQWWYTSENPMLYGTAAPDTTVTINIDDSEYKEMSDSSGNWQLYTDKLTTGNHNINITSNNQTTSFMLNIGSEVPEGTAGATKGGNPVPSTGVTSLMLPILLSLGLLSAGGVMYIKRK